MILTLILAVFWITVFRRTNLLPCSCALHYSMAFSYMSMSYSSFFVFILFPDLLEQFSSMIPVSHRPQLAFKRFPATPDRPGGTKLFFLTYPEWDISHRPSLVLYSLQFGRPWALLGAARHPKFGNPKPHGSSSLRSSMGSSLN